MDGRIQAYQTADTLGRSQLDLILKVYDGALRAFRAASRHYGEELFDNGYEELERAKRFITHLYTTLDFEQGGEVALSLARVYVHIINETNVIQATKSLDRIEVITHMLEEVRAGWQELKNQQVPGKPVEARAESAAVGSGFVTAG